MCKRCGGILLGRMSLARGKRWREMFVEGAGGQNSVTKEHPLFFKESEREVSWSLAAPHTRESPGLGGRQGGGWYSALKAQWHRDVGYSCRGPRAGPVGPSISVEDTEAE